MVKTTRRVFVYGTLMAGQPNHRLLAQARCVGEALTRPEFDLVDLGAFPGLCVGGHTAVSGEVYDVDDPTLLALDRLEGHPHFYHREPIVLADGNVVETYLYPACAGRAVIASGDWRLAKGG